ncbi:CHAT domain-containing protein [Microbacterium sp. QXD-8]|uniref:CHAT domain-containing protein n=1 Tax=Microbacterium psychrotolerans TaxID=3068321 RepID=A0ABU0Z2N6_9MICO|nr:CHAT domain-containing protein [Microbacterium sp. QXD-8]MDQ7878250.1 CHAT domain-containing protein [Microbacterium sp. QXD-8]
MALVPDVPRGTVDVEGDGDSLEVRIDRAPPDVVPDEHGVTLLADVVLHARAGAGAVATVLVRGGDDVHYAALTVRDGIAELIPLERQGRHLYGARIELASGETLHLTVVASDSETGIAWLEEQVAVGGMGMGGGPESATEAAPPPAAPDFETGEAFEPGPVIGGIGGGLGGRSPGLAPAAPPPPAPAPAPPVSAAPAPAPGSPTTSLDGATPVPAVVDAEVPSRVVAGVAFDAVVRLSLEDLVPTAGTAHKKTRARFDPSRDIDVGVQLRGLAFADGTPSVVTTSLPAKGDDPRRLVFRLVPDAPGRGHITVTFTQPPVVTPLAVLALSTPILSDDADDDLAGGTRLVAASVAAPPRSIADLPTLVIDESISRGRSELLITAMIGRTVVKNSVRLDDKSAYVEGIYAELAAIRSAYRQTVEVDPDEAEEAADTVRREVRGLGARIAADLLGDDVNALLWSRRRRISQLVLQTSGELDIPWEILHLVPVGTQRPDPERYFLGDLGLTRWMYGTTRPTVLPVDTSRVVAVAPDYLDRNLTLPRAREEIETLGDLLALSPRSADDPTAFRQAIADGFDLLHFAGHGRWRDAAPRGQEIAFAAFSEDHDDGTASYTDSDARRDLPELDEPQAAASAPFVFLSACDVGRLRSGATGLGGFAEVFLRGGAGVFIGCSWAVRDDVTALFVRTFYAQTLGEGATVGEAVLAARRAAREAGDLTSLAFTVFADPRAKLVRSGAAGGDQP